MLNACEIDEQRHVILRENVRNMQKAMDDMELLRLGCIAHTLQKAVHKGLLSQCSIIDSPANARKVVDQ